MAVSFAASAPAVSDDLRYDARPQRIRVSHDGRVVAETIDAFLVWQPRRIVPLYAIPAADFRVPLIVRGRLDPMPGGLPRVIGPANFEPHTTPGELVSLDLGTDSIDGVAFRPADPDLGGRVILDFAAFDWLEEDEAVIGHPHDPYKRIDVLASDRHITVSLDGLTLADSTSAMLLLETGLPPRWYIPREDVRMDLLTPSDTRTVCAYKGYASYFHCGAAGEAGRDIAWTYVDPLHDALRVGGMLCFYAERVDQTVDGVLSQRPGTARSRPG